PRVTRDRFVAPMLEHRSLALLRRFDCGTRPQSMSHENGYGCHGKDVLRGSPKDEFSKPRMAIPAHDQKIGAEIRALTQEGFGDVRAGDNAGLRCDAMKSKIAG